MGDSRQKLYPIVTPHCRGGDRTAATFDSVRGIRESVMLERYVFRMYTVKAICEVLLQPLVTAALVAAIAFILRLTRQVNAAHVLGAVAISIAFLSSLSPVSDALLRPLEGAYPPLGDGLAVSNAAFIVVLGSAYHPFEGIPITSAISDEGMVRIVEGIRLARA